jgi:hypothetical protein
MVETIALAALVVLGFLVAAASRHIQELYTCLDRMQEKLEHLDELPEIRARVEEIAERPLQQETDELMEWIEERARERRVKKE